MTSYIDHVYHIVEMDSKGLDSIYEDHIRRLVGDFGLFALVKHNLVESCGVINGRKLYVLCAKKETI